MASVSVPEKGFYYTQHGSVEIYLLCIYFSIHIMDNIARFLQFTLMWGIEICSQKAFPEDKKVSGGDKKVSGGDRKVVLSFRLLRV